MIKTIYEPIYKCHVTLIIGESKEKSLKYLKKHANRSDLENNWEESGAFFCSEWRENKECFFNFFIVITDRGMHRWESVLAHEALHVTSRILRERGFKLTTASEEAFTYYLTWIVENFTKAYKMKAKSTSKKDSKKAAAKTVKKVGKSAVKKAKPKGY